MVEGNQKAVKPSSLTKVNEQMSTMEELVSISSLWKAYLLGMVGVADCNAILGLVLKSPWNILKWHPHLAPECKHSTAFPAGNRHVINVLGLFCQTPAFFLCS